jgi:hypothetical protein
VYGAIYLLISAIDLLIVGRAAWPLPVAPGRGASALGLAEDQVVRQGLCPSAASPAELARRLEPLGESGRTALAALADSTSGDEMLCGVAGLASLGDRRAIPQIVRGLRDPNLRGQAHLLARWAAVLAGGPDAGLGQAMLDVVEAVAEPAVWDAAGDDAIWLLGDVDHPQARDRLMAQLDRPMGDARLNAVIEALARQGEPRARLRVTAIGLEAVRDRSGNATPEQARRLGAVAFYQLALAPETMAEGFATLGNIAVTNQAEAAAWAVHTLCARAVRRPADREAIDAHRHALVEELDRRGIGWGTVPVTAPFGCARP